MTAELVIRAARDDDADAFVRAHEAAWDATLAPIVGRSLGELAPFDARVAAFRSGIARASDAAQAWVAEREGEIVGVAVALCETPETVELRDLYVVPTAWGTGVARELMTAALRSVSAEPRGATLWVGEANVRARAFYEREGWVFDGESRTSPLGPRELRYRLQ